MTHWGAGSPVLSPVFKVNAEAVPDSIPECRRMASHQSENAVTALCGGD